MSTSTNETLINHLRKGQIDQFNALRMSSSSSKISFFAEDFSNLQLQNANLSNCDLRKCDFSNSNLSKADISRSNCNEADFSGCTMSAMFVENVQFDQSSACGFFGDTIWQRNNILLLGLILTSF